MTRLEAIDRLLAAGSHKIMAGEWANAVGEPFGVTFQERRFMSGGFKGPTSVCVGVDIHVIAARIARAVGADPPRFHGRGSQFDADLLAARKIVAV